MDSLSPEQRSHQMGRIRTHGTAPELMVRSILRAMGIKFRVRAPHLPGSPDLFLPDKRLVLFVHGCFWHHHPACVKAYIPKTRRRFWLAKFEANRRRDQRVCRVLRRRGYSVAIVWECQLTDRMRATRTIESRLHMIDARRGQSR